MTNGRDRLVKAFEKQRAGRSYEAIWRACYDLIGDAMPTQQALRDYHRNIPEKWNVELVAALCRVYKLRIDTIAPDMLPRFERLAPLVNVAPTKRSLSGEGESRPETLQPAAA